MNANEIHAGKDYLVKIAFNEVKVKVLSHIGHSWIVRTAGGRIMPIQNIDRFVQVAPVGELPLPTSATPAEAEEIPNSEVPVPPLTINSAKKLSMLDAAAKVLKTAGHPMTIKEILAAMEESGLWTQGRGRTPANSLVAAIGLEIRKRTKRRFHKTAPGTFEFGNKNAESGN